MATKPKIINIANKEFVLTIEYKLDMKDRLEQLFEEELDILRQYGEANIIKAEVKDK